MFSVRYEAAKLIEEEQEAELEETERRSALTDLTERDRPVQCGTSLTPADRLSGAVASGSGSGSSGWQESESGMFWEPDVSTLDSSADGRAALHAARQQAAALAGTASTAASQDDDDNYTRGYHCYRMITTTILEVITVIVKCLDRNDKPSNSVWIRHESLQPEILLLLLITTLNQLVASFDIMCLIHVCIIIIIIIIIVVVVVVGVVVNVEAKCRRSVVHSPVHPKKLGKIPSFHNDMTV